MVDRIRSREKNKYQPTTQTDYWNSGSIYYSTGLETHYPSCTFRKETIDEVHDWPPRNDTERQRDIGGPFTMRSASLKTNFDITKKFSLGTRGPNGRFFYGNVIPFFYDGYGPLRTDVTPSEAFYYWPIPGDETFYGEGAKAIAATIPTNPHADAAVGVAELVREGLPSLIGASLLRDRVGFFRSLGSEYLNYEFGWKPLLSDIMSICESISDSEELLSQLARDSGKNVRRRFAFPIQRETTYANGNQIPVNMDMYLWNQRSRTETVLTYSRSWFSGSYTYYYDPSVLTEASRIATQARYLLGIRIDPEVLWNLTPWSWLVDWFTNVGPVLHNLSAFQQDGLVLRYGYLMHHDIRRTEAVHWDVTLPYGGNFPHDHASASLILERKRRIRATPYGFGVNMSSLTTRQFAILTSLGITLRK